MYRNPHSFVKIEAPVTQTYEQVRPKLEAELSREENAA